MDSSVLNKRIFLNERSVAFVALEHLFAVVDFHVLLPIISVLKVRVTNFTLERPLSEELD